jgi:hypothetical protein
MDFASDRNNSGVDGGSDVPDHSGDLKDPGEYLEVWVSFYDSHVKLLVLNILNEILRIEKVAHYFADDLHWLQHVRERELPPSHSLGCLHCSL